MCHTYTYMHAQPHIKFSTLPHLLSDSMLSHSQPSCLYFLCYFVSLLLHFCLFRGKRLLGNSIFPLHPSSGLFHLTCSIEAAGIPSLTQTYTRTHPMQSHTPSLNHTVYLQIETEKWCNNRLSHTHSSQYINLPNSSEGRQQTSR